MKKAAKIVGVSPDSIEKAGHLKKAAPEKYEEVKAGKKSLDAAVQEVKADKSPKAKPVKQKPDLTEEWNTAAGVVQSCSLALRNMIMFKERRPQIEFAIEPEFVSQLREVQQEIDKLIQLIG